MSAYNKCHHYLIKSQAVSRAEEIVAGISSTVKFSLVKLGNESEENVRNVELSIISLY